MRFTKKVNFFTIRTSLVPRDDDKKLNRCQKTLKSLSLKNVTLRKFVGAHELYAEFPHCAWKGQFNRVSGDAQSQPFRRWVSEKRMIYRQDNKPGGSRQGYSGIVVTVSCD